MRYLLLLAIIISTALSGPAMAGPALHDPKTNGLSINPGEDKEFLKFGPSTHKPTYLMYQWGDPDPRDGEIGYTKFQFSLKQHLLDMGGDKIGVYFGFTQKSLWSTSATSKPFKDSNYNPEIFFDLNTYRITADNFRFTPGLWGFEHESNGRADEYGPGGALIHNSRSWNRFYLQPEADYDDGQTRVWSALKIWPIVQDMGDNRDLQDYYGSGELMIGFRSGQWEGLARTRKGWSKDWNMELNAAWWWDERFALLFQMWQGYGESLLDYDKFTTRFGLGFEFNHLLPERRP